MDSLPSVFAADLPGDSYPSPVRSFGFRLWHLRHAWTRRLEAALAPLGLTHMQYMLLRGADYLARQGERPAQAHLAEGLAMDRMTVSKVLRLLDAKGLVVRAAHPDDPRANHVVLTEAGRRTLVRAVGLAEAEQARFFGALGTERQAQFSAMLDDLLAVAGRPLAGHPSRERIVSTATMGGEG